MNLNSKKVSVYYNIFSFLFLLLGILYIYLGEVSMGFARDLVYREYLIKENILFFINKDFFIFIWVLPILYLLYKSKKEKKFTFFLFINICIFIFLIIASYFYLEEYLIFFTILNIFAFLRLFTLDL